MPPRYSYWTIIVDNLPTAFRAARREELLPTFERLYQKHPSAVMRWFSKGQLWSSPSEADGATAHHNPGGRGRDWRPGGAHRDPRDRFKKPRDERPREGAHGRGLREPRAPGNEGSSPEPPARGRPDARAHQSNRRPPDARARTAARGGVAAPSGRRGSSASRPPGTAGTGAAGSRTTHAGSGGQQNRRRPPSSDFSRNVRPAAAGSRDAAQRPRPKDRPHQPRDRGRTGEGSRQSSGVRRPQRPGGTTPGRAVPERKRDVPPAPPPGPDREPRPGQEPPPLPSKAEEIIIPPEPPERGAAEKPVPNGGRLVVRRKHRREPR
jgi:hypothetical protein